MFCFVFLFFLFHEFEFPSSIRQFQTGGELTKANDEINPDWLELEPLRHAKIFDWPTGDKFFYLWLREREREREREKKEEKKKKTGGFSLLLIRFNSNFNFRLY